MGMYQIRVVPFDATDWAFRMRATLEEGPSDEPDLLAPDLRVWPPFEFGLIAPANPLSGLARDSANPPGSHPVSCTWSETAGSESSEKGPPTASGSPPTFTTWEPGPST